MPLDEALMHPTRPRILHREWKRYKQVSTSADCTLGLSSMEVQHLPKSNSLPVLKLIPLDRPLFECQRCGFSNSRIPICLWCAWESDQTTRAFEQSTRGRRVSAPPKVFWVPMVRHEAKEAEAKTRVTSRVTRRNREHVGDTYVFIARATTRGSKSQSKPKSLGDDYSDAPVRARHNHPRSVDRPMNPSPSISSSITDVTHATHNSLLPPIHVSPRVLRHKKHVSFLRKKSSRSLRTKVSMERPLSAPEPYVGRMAADPIVPPCPSPDFRLGHPMRPYYSAIRKNMTRPSSPCDYNFASRPSSPSLAAFSTSRISTTLSDSDVHRSPFHFPARGHSSFQDPPPAMGCSLSGETELRMALARNPDGSCSEYKFLKLERGGKRKGGVRSKVRQLSKDLKDFVLGAAPRL